MTNLLYPSDFYSNRRERTAYAAVRILDALPSGLVRRRVADVGCGTGTFLAAALASGTEQAIGLEGDWVQPGQVDDPRIALLTRNLEEPLQLPPVDLVLCLEVAEHLSPARAESFVAELARAAPAVLFSAAIPNQGGVGHRNEQWQGWWARLFEKEGRLAFDTIRPQIWADDDIPAWYRQNMVLYLTPELGAAVGLVPTAPSLLDRVHPRYWERAGRELRYAGAQPESEVLAEQARLAGQQ
jgi:SAM-dependent methyltransferase